MFSLLLALALAPGASAHEVTTGCPPHRHSPDEEFKNCFVSANVAERTLGANRFTPSSPVRIQIYETRAAFDAGAAPVFDATVQSDSGGAAGAGPAVNPAARNYVVATDQASGVSKMLDISPVEVEPVDTANDRVTGTALAGERVKVTVLTGGLKHDANVFADGNGRWAAGPSDFQPPNPDITVDSDVGASVFDDDGDQTSASRAPGCPPPAINPRVFCSLGANVDDDGLGVRGMAPNSEVRFTFATQAGGPVRFGPVSAMTDERGNATYNGLTLDTGLDIVPAASAPFAANEVSYVEAVDVATGVVKSVVVADVSIDTVDPAANLTAGRAPPGPVTVASALGGPGPVTAQSNGTWSVDWAAQAGFDFGDAASFTAGVSDADFDGTAAVRGVPVPGCQPSPEVQCGDSAGSTLWVESKPAAARAAEPTQRKALAGAGADTVVVTYDRRIGEVKVDLGTGTEDRFVVQPGRGARGASPQVRIGGRSSRVTGVLPAHTGPLVVTMSGTGGADDVSVRELGGRGKTTGGYHLVGAAGADALVSGDGSDRLGGGVGDDVLDGGPGDDVLDGDPGDDVLDGGAGRDTCVKRSGDTLTSCERIRRS